MSLPVADQTRLLSKRLAANVANIRSLSGVNQHMLFLSCLSSKRLSADGTRERLHTRMHPHVRVKITSSKSLATGRAEHFLPGFVPHEVLLQILLRGHAPSTYSADKIRLVVSVLHMRFESMEVLAKVTANVAHDRRSSAVILFHMMIQSFLDFKLLAAGIARVIVIARVQSNVVILQSALIVALVLAYTALVHLLTMILLDVGDQVTPETESLRTVGAFVSVLLKMFSETAFLEKFTMTMIAFYVSRLSPSRSISFVCNLQTRFLC